MVEQNSAQASYDDVPTVEKVELKGSIKYLVATCSSLCAPLFLMSIFCGIWNKSLEQIGLLCGISFLLVWSMFPFAAYSEKKRTPTIVIDINGLSVPATGRHIPWEEVEEFCRKGVTDGTVQGIHSSSGRYLYRRKNTRSDPYLSILSVGVIRSVFGITESLDTMEFVLKDGSFFESATVSRSLAERAVCIYETYKENQRFADEISHRSREDAYHASIEAARAMHAAIDARRRAEMKAALQEGKTDPDAEDRAGGEENA